ncbi:MAG TPA: energy transducer TonB [Terriglobales bacterium]
MTATHSQELRIAKLRLAGILCLGLLVLAFAQDLRPRLHAQEAVERKRIYKVEPKYPEYLKRHEIGGVVRLSVEITPKGTVRTVEPLGGNPILVESAIEAVKQWKYEPAETSTTVEVKIDFNPR